MGKSILIFVDRHDSDKNYSKTIQFDDVKENPGIFQKSIEDMFDQFNFEMIKENKIGFKLIDGDNTAEILTDLYNFNQIIETGIINVYDTILSTIFNFKFWLC